MKTILTLLHRFVPPLTARTFGLLVQGVVGWVTLHFASAADLGVYYVFVAWTMTLGWVLGFGLPEQAMRIVSVALAANGIVTARRLGLVAMALSLGSGLIAYVVLALAAWLPALLIWADPALAPLLWSPENLPPALLTAFGVIGLVGSRVGAQVLKSFRAATTGLYAEYVLPFLPLLIGTLFLGMIGQLEGKTLAWLHVSGGLLAIVISAAILSRRPARMMKTEESHTPLRQELTGILANTRHLLEGVGAQWLAVALQSVLLNLPLIIVSIVADEAAAGVFGLCTRLAAITLIGTDVIISMRGPTYAEYHSKGDHAALEQVFAASRRAALAMTVPLFALIWIFATPILNFFGVADLAPARHVLLILLGGRLVYAFVGPVSYFLWMIREFRAEILATATALATLIITSFIASRVGLGDPMIALAGATTLSLSVRFVLQFVFARRRITPLVGN